MQFIIIINIIMKLIQLQNLSAENDHTSEPKVNKYMSK